MAPCVIFDQATSLFHLLAGSSVEEQLGSVTCDDDAIMKLFTQIVPELIGIKTLDQRASMSVLAQINLQTPIIIHRIPPLASNRLSNFASVDVRDRYSGLTNCTLW